MKCKVCGGNSTQDYCSKLCEDTLYFPVNNPELLDKCYCVDSSLQLHDFEVTEYTICHYRFNPSVDTFSVFMQYAIAPCSRITGELNKQLFHQYNLSRKKFEKHFRTLGEWREDQINSILNEETRTT